MRGILLWVVVCVGLAYGAPTLAAEPGTAEMIEQLSAPKGRTRALRNLSVEAASPAADAAPQNPQASSSANTVEAAAGGAPSLSLMVQFDYNSAKVSPASQQVLLNLAQALQSSALAGSRFAIEGHTDAKGGAAYNLRLSWQRAFAVVDFLTQQGVATNRLSAMGKGDVQLANAAQPFAAENRRVRIVNLTE